VLAGVLAAILTGAGMASAPLAAAAAAAASRPVRPVFKACGTGAAVRQPASIVLTCADRGMTARRLRWTSWTATGATATGTVTWRLTSTDAGRTTADITLTDPVRGAGGTLVFTALRLHVTGATPRGFIRDATFDEAPSAVTAPGSRIAAPRALPGRAGASGAGASGAGASGQLDVAGIEGFWVLAGGQSAGSVRVPGYGTYTYPQIAAAITGAESSFLPGNILLGAPYADTGWGLWQITPGDSEPRFGVDYQLLDPWNNAEAAVAKYDASGFLPWTVYTSGVYERFLPDAQGVAPDTALTDPGQYEPYDAPAPAGTHNSSSPGTTYGPPIG
jgi:hypothetical protein